MADFDLSGFGDLANFSLGGAETSGPSFGGGYSLSPAVSSGFDFNVPDVGTITPDVSAFGQLASAAKGAGKAVAGGVQDVLQPVADIAKPLVPLAGLATAGMGIGAGVQNAKTAAQQAQIARQNQRLQQSAAANTMAAAQPLTQFGQEQLQAAQQGKIPAAIQAKIDQWKAGALAMAKDRLARQGLGDSQAMDQWVQYIEQQAQAMAATYLQEEQRLGLQGLTQGAQTIASAGGQAGQVVAGAQGQQGAIDNLMKQTNEALARLGAAA